MYMHTSKPSSTVVLKIIKHFVFDHAMRPSEGMSNNVINKLVVGPIVVHVCSEDEH